MATTPDAATIISETPVFYETLAAALHTDVPLAAGIYREVSQTTDLNRVGESLDWAI